MTTAGIGSQGNDAAPPPRLSELLQSRCSPGSGAASSELDTILMDIVDAAQRACPTVSLLRRQVRGRREVALEDDELLQKVVAPGDPQLDYAKGMYCEQFERAFERR